MGPVWRIHPVSSAAASAAPGTPADGREGMRTDGG